MIEEKKDEEMSRTRTLGELSEGEEIIIIFG
jgi:hypothetical protein